MPISSSGVDILANNFDASLISLLSRLWSKCVGERVFKCQKLHNPDELDMMKYAELVKRVACASLVSA